MHLGDWSGLVIDKLDFLALKSMLSDTDLVEYNGIICYCFCISCLVFSFISYITSISEDPVLTKVLNNF